MGYFSRRRVSQFAIFVSLLLAQPVAASDMHLDVEVGTELPIALGLSVGLEWPNGLRASSSAGYLPGRYVALINEVVQSVPNSYDSTTGDLIEETLQDSLIWRTHIGWQLPYGMYADAGYGLAALGGGTSTEALLAGLTGRAAPSTSGNARTYAVGSTLHMLDAEFGWKRVYRERFTVRAAIGVAATVAATATVEADSKPNQSARRRLIEEFESFSERYLVDTYTTYMFSPVITMSLGYRLF